MVGMESFAAEVCLLRTLLSATWITRGDKWLSGTSGFMVIIKLV